MNIEEMKHDDIQLRLKEIETEMTADDADLEKLSAEVDALQAREADLRARAESAKELRARVAGAQVKAIDSTKSAEEVRKEGKKNMPEFRNSPEYINAYAEATKTNDWTECRSLLTENVGDGTIQVPDFVADKIEAAWQNDPIMQRLNRVFIKGNYTVGFEIEGTDAVIHVEGTEAPAEEQLTLGKVTIVPQNIKKWISVSDEVMDLKGQAFLDYVYDEISYKIVKKAGQTALAAAVTAALSTDNSLPYVATLKANLGAATIVEAEAELTADEATDVVAVMTRKTHAALRKLQISSGQNVGDVFDGIEPIKVSAGTLSDYSDTLAENTPYMIIGDLDGITANFPNGNEVKFVFDEYTLSPEDMVRIIGRLFVGIAVTKPGYLTVVTKAAA